MKTSQSGIDLIKKFEGFSATPYKDIAGLLTIGYGHLILPSEHFGALSSVEAYALLMRDIAEKAEYFVNKFVTVDLLQNEFDALVSFTFNVGGANFQKSTLLKLLNAGKKEDVPQEFLKWANAGGHKSEALLKRRQLEAKLFSGT
jgi:GH24 family phage-related lysozyme (muramidase)